MPTFLDYAHINISGSEAYEKEVTHIVNRILMTKTGQAIDFKIRTHGWIWIVERDRSELQGDGAEPDAALSQEHIHYYPISKESNKTVFKFEGQDVRVRTLRQSPGWGPDEILFHEMVHAARVLGGDTFPVRRRAVSFDKDSRSLLSQVSKTYDDEEEYFAVLVTNIYTSEKGKPLAALRKGHNLLSDHLTESEAAPNGFLLKDYNYSLIETFCRQHPNMAPMIAKAPATFNPIRDYYKSREPDKKEEKTTQITQHETRPTLTDDLLISVLAQRFHADDVAGYGPRARRLEQIFQHLNVAEALPLFTRLNLRRPGDKVASLFHDHLHTQTRQKLLGIARGRMAGK